MWKCGALKKGPQVSKEKPGEPTNMILIRLIQTRAVRSYLAQRLAGS